MRTVQLHSAFVWTCPSCQCHNLAKPILVEIPSDEIEASDLGEFRNPHGGGCLANPDTVSCRYCRTRFAADYGREQLRLVDPFTCR